MNSRRKNNGLFVMSILIFVTMMPMNTNALHGTNGKYEPGTSVSISRTMTGSAGFPRANAHTGAAMAISAAEQMIADHSNTFLFLVMSIISTEKRLVITMV